MADRDRCGLCKFYDEGTCRINPPVRLPRKFVLGATAGNRVRDETLIWGWPQVRGDDWCGSFKHFLARPWWKL